ncbi:unnamed protein product [Albugo candida]|uniref:Uncharacterized protein n=1 Tax=Albugo candida TaxID=65357 RepID=A0A024FTF1_9STRA|nr:unnamed protein product [Albugo candida]|eukprot:CCI10187.1 unnamed protein product [Albugo candida]
MEMFSRSNQHLVFCTLTYFVALTSFKFASALFYFQHWSQNGCKYIIFVTFLVVLICPFDILKVQSTKLSLPSILLRHYRKNVVNTTSYLIISKSGVMRSMSHIQDMNILILYLHIPMSLLINSLNGLHELFGLGRICSRETSHIVSYPICTTLSMVNIYKVL